MALSRPRSSQLAVAAGLGLSTWAGGAAFATLRAPGGSLAPEASSRRTHADGHPTVRGHSFSTDSVPLSVPTAAGLAVLGVGAAAALLQNGALARGPAAARRTGKQAVALAAFESELGAQAPVGFWDPLGFTNDGDEASFKRRRSVEIKHGRICMLATMGYITPEITGKLPGYLSPSTGLKFEDIPNGLGAVSKVPAAGWLQIIAYFGFCEFSGGFEDYKTGTPGDYGFKVLTSDDPEEKTKKLSAEIANGRLAMVAIIGMFFQDGLTGSAWGDWALYTDSPLRARP